MLTVKLKTLGCKLNQAESAMIAQDFIDRGYLIVDEGKSADVSVINTCTVTGRSDAKCRQAIRQAIKMNAQTTIIVTGCYSQVSAEDIAKISGVDYILGVQEKIDIFQNFSGPGKLSSPMIAVSSVRQAQEVIPHPVGNYGSQTRAVLKIQNGCDNHCTYCIVPVARGPSRSLPIQDVLKQAQQLVKTGFREIVLTGVHVGEYGKTLADHSNLPELLRELVKIEGLSRIRLTSLEPENVSDALLDVILQHPKICLHFHLSIQSGSPQILKAMKRQSDLPAIENALKKIVNRFPDVGLGADIIVGFPGEEDVHFQETVELLTRYPFSYFHVFPYSARPGTPAADFPNQIPNQILMERARKCRALGEEKASTFRKKWIGRQAIVLFEGRNRKGWMSGWTSQYLRVEAPFDPAWINRLVNVELEALTEQGVRGRVFL